MNLTLYGEPRTKKNSARTTHFTDYTIMLWPRHLRN